MKVILTSGWNVGWVQEPVLSTIRDQQHQANIVVTIECVSSAHLPLFAQVSAQGENEM